MELNTDEQLRIRTLKEYQILDTEVEPVYDDITGLASTICRTPISLMSFIDKDRQWFKSHRGTSLRQSPLATSICACVAEQRAPLIVPDTMKDPRFQDMELMRGPPFIRFYAGAPLISSEGVAIGALCVIDLEPRLLTSQQAEALNALARQAMEHLEYRRFKNNLQDQKSQMAHEIIDSLTIINGTVGLLRRNVGQSSERAIEKSNLQLESIERSVYRIDNLILGLK